MSQTQGEGVSCISFPSMLMTTIDDGNVRVWGPSDCVGSIDRSIDREQSKERWIIDFISHQPSVLFSQNKSATSNEPAVLFS
jgi:hypothetical protein